MTRNNAKNKGFVARFLTALLLSALLLPMAQAQNTGSMSPAPGGSGPAPSGGNSQGGSNPAYNGFNPMTGTWSTSGSNSPPMNPTNGFNQPAGTWAGSTSTATGGAWSTGTSANGSSMNVFTPNQAVSGSTASSFANSASGNRLSSGPKVIPHVSVRPRLPIYNRVPTRNRF